MSENFANAKTYSAVSTRYRPNTSDILCRPLGSHVLVFWSELYRWNGTLPLLHVNDRTCTMLLTPSSERLSSSQLS